MTTSDLAIIVRGIGPALREYVSAAISPLVARLVAVEAKERAGLDSAPVPGPIGPPGPMGIPGRDGMSVAGPQGANGKDGADGKDGEDGGAGLNGKDGADGLGFDDFEELYDGERTITRRYSKGDRVKEFVHKMPIEIYQGVYMDGTTYERGDGVTWGGSEWHANEATTTKPGDGSKAWTLKVKKGRDGRDGRDAPGALPVVSVGRNQ